MQYFINTSIASTVKLQFFYIICTVKYNARTAIHVCPVMYSGDDESNLLSCIWW